MFSTKNAISGKQGSEGEEGMKKIDTTDRGMFYDSKVCCFCGELIYGESTKSRREAKTDLYYAMKKHSEKHKE